MSTVSLLINVLGPVLVLVSVVAGARLNIQASTLAPLAYWILGPSFVFDLFQARGLEPSTDARLSAAGLASLMTLPVVLAHTR